MPNTLSVVRAISPLTADVEDQFVKQGANGIPILVKNVATVQLGGDIRRGLLEKNGEGEVVGGIVVMRSGENARDVIDRVKQRIEEIKPGLPPGVDVVASYDRSTLIEAAIGTLNRALIEASIIVAVVVAIFLLHFRSIVRILIELPVSILLSFILMYLFGITSNIMSLGGIVLAIGVIVDSSIVIVENAYRNIANALASKKQLTNEEYRDISILSAKQVGRAIFFSELIILVGFLPVFLLTGQEGKFFHPLAFTKTFVMISSAVVVITLIPVLMTMLMRGKFKPESANPITRFFIRLYQPVIQWVLRHRKATIAINVLALLVTVPMIMHIGSEFMPPLDEGSILYMPVTLPNASVSEVARILALQDRIIRTVPEVHHVLGKAGRAETATDNAPLSMIETIIMLKPRDEWRPGITKKDIVQELDAKLQIPGVRNGWTQPIINRINMLSTGVRTDIGLKIFGDDLDTLEHYAIQAEQILKACARYRRRGRRAYRQWLLCRHHSKEGGTRPLWTVGRRHSGDHRSWHRRPESRTVCLKVGCGFLSGFGSKESTATTSKNSGGSSSRSAQGGQSNSGPGRTSRPWAPAGASQAQGMNAMGSAASPAVTGRSCRRICIRDDIADWRPSFRRRSVRASLGTCGHTDRYGPANDQQ